MHKISKEVGPHKRYKLKIKPPPQELYNNTNKRDHRPKLGKPTSKGGLCNSDPEMWNRYVESRLWNVESSKGASKLGQDKLQSIRTNSGKFSNSFPYKILSIHIRNLPFFSTKHINKKYQNRVSHCENVQLTRQKRRRKANLAKQQVWKIIEDTTCSQWSKHVLAIIQHKNRRPKIISSRKLIISNNQLHDYIQGIASHATKTHDPHDVAHNLVTVNHEKHERPKKPTKASHERCTAVVRKRTVDNIKRGHSLKNVPEVLVELSRRSRG